LKIFGKFFKNFDFFFENFEIVKNSWKLWFFLKFRKILENFDFFFEISKNSSKNLILFLISKNYSNTLIFFLNFEKLLDSLIFWNSFQKFVKNFDFLKFRKILEKRWFVFLKTSWKTSVFSKNFNRFKTSICFLTIWTNFLKLRIIFFVIFQTCKFEKKNISANFPTLVIILC